MIFGLNLPNYSSLGHRDAVIAIAERADELGYSSLWTSDHILLPATLPEPYGNLLESFTTLSYLAARTERIRLATGILPRTPPAGPIAGGETGSHRPPPGQDLVNYVSNTLLNNVTVDSDGGRGPIMVSFLCTI
jgi:hypothetical protein